MPSRWGLQNETEFHNRVHIGQITGVRADDGLITVRLTTGAVHKMPIPVYGFSMPLARADGQVLRSGTRASWMRYMPQVGDFVKVAYGPDNRPEVISAATWGDLPSEVGPQGQLGGYAQYSRARDRGEPGMEVFFKLNPGEWDMRSSGNAYIRGGQFGTLSLAGGGVSVFLRKEQEQFDARAGRFEFDSTGARMRLGDVKRQLSSGFQEDQVQGSGKEFELQVNHQAAPSPAPPLEFYEFRAGDLRDSAGVVETGVSGPLRLRERVLDGAAQAGQPVPYVREIDALGNVTETLATTATSHQITGSALAEFSRTGYLSMTHEAATSITLASARVALGSATASQPVPRGTDLVTQLMAIVVPTALGPSGPPLNAGAFPGTLSTVTFTD